MVTSDFRPNVEIWPILVCTMKNITVEVTVVSSDHNYMNSSVIVDSAVGRYYVPQHVFLFLFFYLCFVVDYYDFCTIGNRNEYSTTLRSLLT